MSSTPTSATLTSINAPDDLWHERLHTVCYKHFSHYDEDFQHMQLYWGCLTRLFTHWLKSKNLPIPDWTTTNPRLPAWVTILFETDEMRIVNNTDRLFTGGADESVASLMDGLYNHTFSTWFAEAAHAQDLASSSSSSSEHEHSHVCHHDLLLEFLNYILLTPIATSTTILYEDEAMTQNEILYNGMLHSAFTLLKHHRYAEDARICPPLSLNVDHITGIREMVIPFKIFHAFVAAGCELDDFGDALAQWLPGALLLKARMEITYTAAPYEEEVATSPSSSGENETVTVINPTSLTSLRISVPGDEAQSHEYQDFFDEHIRPYLEGREVFVEAADVKERGKWEGKDGPYEVDEEGNVLRPRVLGVLGVIEHLVMEERAGEVQ
ncbi:hypothetical protein CLAFUW4_05478 [Fulvia fulva]|uniref:Uncharacterized protein n=1 Tax=Passalora fulva TaxID=5499 RepID=A0A9Q8LJ91_PASFU|nr:uncharacterized protein CLAFUR5_05621 [Fulvia fulva]KAK4623554.1 hypothetical protein CLAFUR4_05472 [Fulvia fulva]KAK4625483.1 hypothetical protein CLAFUR0_05480 [Fulvia fulva]UJO18159.1 hypothetical protein CLAFUR5_05621 [Fulvia fulva]WPV15201.1 hypothetical protein CLAFUW4_05478 [Fulvia fulva]WPV30491.1 hypothetical protein CLAFUW7_05476 [Fulvia fulva]